MCYGRPWPTFQGHPERAAGVNSNSAANASDTRGRMKLGRSILETPFHGVHVLGSRLHQSWTCHDTNSSGKEPYATLEDNVLDPMFNPTLSNQNMLLVSSHRKALHGLLRDSTTKLAKAYASPLKTKPKIRMAWLLRKPSRRPSSWPYLRLGCC